jgi:hypothetical protein
MDFIHKGFPKLVKAEKVNDTIQIELTHVKMPDRPEQMELYHDRKDFEDVKRFQILEKFYSNGIPQVKCGISPDTITFPIWKDDYKKILEAEKS